MKRVHSRLTLFFILYSLLMPALGVTWILEVKGVEQTSWEEIVESLEENGNFTFEPQPYKLPEDSIRVTFFIDYRWFSFRLFYDNVSETYSVYSQGELVVGDSTTDEGELVAKNMRGPAVSRDGTYNPLDIMGWFEIKEDYNSVRVYYDGVEVLVVAENQHSSVIKVLSPKNTTYNSPEVPLEYKVNLAFYTATYSLDKQANVTVVGNTVLRGLADGAHLLTVYVNYTNSYMCESDTVWFTVDTIPPNITDVSQTPVSINGTLEDGVKVKATVTDAVSEIDRVALKYSDGNGTWVTHEMKKLEEDVWDGTIPAFPHGTNVTYTIIAEDKAGNKVTTEELSGAPKQYEVLPEFPLWIILSLFLIATASILFVRKRISIPAFTKISSRLYKVLN